MSDSKIYDVPAEFAAHAHIDAERYRALYERSIADPEGFWAEQAEQFVKSCRYPPKGFRSFGPTRAMLYAGSDYPAHANDTVLTFAMIETEEAMANLDEIVATPGLDGVYIGPADLSLAHGRPPKFDHTEPEMMAVIERILAIGSLRW